MLAIPQLPVDYIYISQGFTGSHKGIDIGYKSGALNPPIYAVSDGEVAMKTKDQYGGLFIVLRHKSLVEGKWCYSCYWHLASFADTYKVGDQIKRGHMLGKMGKTGNATGVHLHFEFWIGPSGVKFSSTNRRRDAVNPVDYIYAYPGQSISDKNAYIKVYTAMSPADDPRDEQIKDLSQKLSAAVARADTAEKDALALRVKIDAALEKLR